jgi:hypothetical protein
MIGKFWLSGQKIMTSNDGDDAGTHHEGRKRESAKRKGGVLVMRRGEEGAGGVRGAGGEGGAGGERGGER